MKEIAISKFKAKCSAIIETVRRTRVPVRVTRSGKPVAEIVPAAAIIDRAQWIGSMKDSTEVLGDIISPANGEDEWNSLRD